jgi:hypothetical protein
MSVCKNGDAIYCEEYLNGECNDCGGCGYDYMDTTYEKTKMDIYGDVPESEEMDKKISEEMNNLRELGKKLSEETEDANLCFIVSKIVEQKELISDLIGERLGLY